MGDKRGQDVRPEELPDRNGASTTASRPLPHPTSITWSAGLRPSVLRVLNSRIPIASESPPTMRSMAFASPCRETRWARTFS
jgi:hypothetical protein